MACPTGAVQYLFKEASSTFNKSSRKRLFTSCVLLCKSLLSTHPMFESASRLLKDCDTGLSKDNAVLAQMMSDESKHHMIRQHMHLIDFSQDLDDGDCAIHRAYRYPTKRLRLMGVRLLLECDPESMTYLGKEQATVMSLATRHGHEDVFRTCIILQMQPITP